MREHETTRYAEPLQELDNKQVAAVGRVHYSTGRRWREKGEIEAVELARDIIRRADHINPTLSLALRRYLIGDPTYLPPDQEPVECSEDALITEAILSDGEVAVLLRTLIESRHPRSRAGHRLHPDEKCAIRRVLDQVITRVLRFQRLLHSA
jgi:hypothetical protein